MDTCIVPPSLAIVNSVEIFAYKFIHGQIFSFLLGIYLGVELSAHKVTQGLAFCRRAWLPSRTAACVACPLAVHFPHLLLMFQCPGVRAVVW